MTGKLILALSAALLAPAIAQAQTMAPMELTRDALPDNSDANRIEDVRADIAGAIPGWSGVRSCSRESRARDALRAGFDRWIGQQTMARPGRLLLTYGWSSGRWWYRNRTSGSGRRSCKGGYSAAPVYARFY